MTTLNGAQKAITEIKRKSDPAKTVIIRACDMTEAEAKVAIAEAEQNAGTVIVLTYSDQDFDLQAKKTIELGYDNPPPNQ